MKLLLVLIFIVGSHSAPHSSILSPIEEEFRTGLVQVPEGCSFLSSTQETVDGVIKGEYTYEDPIGSQITVTYQVNVDGSDYVERRKIIKGYGTDGSGFDENLLTADQVVEQVKTELRPVIIQIVRPAVLNSDVDLSNYGNLVETIMVQLNPVVTAAVNNALATSPHSHLDANELITRILTELRPFVVEAVRHEVEAQKPKLTEEDIVIIVEKQLEGTVITVIKQAVAASTDTHLFENQEKLVQTIMVQLRPVVLQAVKRALDASNIHGFNENSLTGKVIVALTPFVRRGVGAQIAELEAQKKANAGQIVTSVITDLRPIIVRIIKESVRNYKGDLSKYGNLVESILGQLRPVVLAEVKRALETTHYKGLDAEDLTTKIIAQLRTFVEEGVQEQVRLLQQELQNSADQVVESVISTLKPIVPRIIKGTVKSSNADLSQYDNLVQTIISQLRPVVLKEVTRALATSHLDGKINAGELTQRIIVRLTPLVQEGVQERLREIELENKITPDEIVDNVIAQLKPITIKVVHETVINAKNDIDDEEELLQTIVKQLRPVVLAQVTSAIRANNADYNAQELSNKIVARLIPFIREGIRKEVEIKKQQNQGTLVSDIINKLDPHIHETIKDALGSGETVLDEGMQQQSISGVLGKLRPIIKQAVLTVMTRLQAAGTLDSTSDEEIIRLVNLELKNGLLLKLLEDEVAKLIGDRPLPSQDVMQGLLQSMLPAIRRMILLEIAAWRETANPKLSSSQEGQVLSNVLGSLRGQVEVATNQLLEQSPDSIGDNVVVQRIIQQFRPTILSAMQNDRTIQQVFATASFADSDAFEILLQRIIQALRAIILEQIRLYRSRVTVPPPTVKPAPTGNELTDLFGFGGSNTVQVETPHFSYEYDHDKPHTGQFK